LAAQTAFDRTVALWRYPRGFPWSGAWAGSAAGPLLGNLGSRCGFNTILDRLSPTVPETQREKPSIAPPCGGPSWEGLGQRRDSFSVLQTVLAKRRPGLEEPGGKEECPESWVSQKKRWPDHSLPDYRTSSPGHNLSLSMHVPRLHLPFGKSTSLGAGYFYILDSCMDLGLGWNSVLLGSHQKPTAVEL
jgi:hypothetical protein